MVERLNVAITHLGADQQPEVLRFPPAMRRTDFEDSEYLKSFPNLAGTIHSFCGNDMGHQRLLRALDDAMTERDDDRSDEWMAQQKPTRVVLTPAACYPIYPVMARRGPLPAEGRTIDVLSYCFRHEPSLDPARMQMFRQREYVRLGNAEQVMAFRQMWIERGSALMNMLQLPVEVDLANDPFFGRGGKIVADSQRAQALKFELLIPVADAARQDRLPVVQLSHGPLRRDLEDRMRGRLGGAHGLRRLRHGAHHAGAVPSSRPRRQRVAGRRARAAVGRYQARVAHGMQRRYGRRGRRRA